MDNIIHDIITQYGVLGVIVILAGYIIWDKISSSKSGVDVDEKLDDIKTDINDIKVDIPVMSQKISLIEKEVLITNEKFDEKIEFLETKINNKIENLENRIKEQPNHVIQALNVQSQRQHDNHNKQMMNQIHLAPKLHKAMGEYVKRVGCDHMFLGSFHNGTTSLSGIPYYKFDIVAEKFKPEMVCRDCEFGHMYKDVDILRHDKLPTILMQNEQIHYIINKDKTSELSEIDDILYRRMCGRDIKQLAINILHDPNGIPMGFIGCVKYDYNDLNLSELSNCAYEIEIIYNNI